MKVFASRSRRLKELLQRPTPSFITSAPNVMMARMMQAIGYETVYVGAAATIGRMIGRPDDGTITLTESVTFSKWFVDGTDLCVWTDADVCFGGPAQVHRAVTEYIRVGVAGVTIEDQPLQMKRFGGAEGKQVLPLPDAVEKYRTAVETRNDLDADFQIIARSDALRATNSGGVTETIDRLLAYKDAGADVLYLEAPTSFEEITAVRSAVPGPLVCTTFRLPRDLSLDDARELGLAAIFGSRWRADLTRFGFALLHAQMNGGPDAVERLRALIPEIDDEDFRPHDGTALGDIRWSFKWTGAGAGQPSFLQSGARAPEHAEPTPGAS